MVILHRDGRALLQLRDSAPGVYAGGQWGIFGGHLEPGEAPEAAARREIEEELNLRLPDGEPLPLVVHRTDAGRERFVYAALLTVALDRLSLREGQGMGLIPREAYASHPIVPIHREILERFFEGR